MKWIVSVQLLSGILFVRRKLNALVENGLLEEKSVPKYTAGILFLLFLATFFAFEHPRTQFIAIFLVITVISASHFIFSWRLRTRIQSRFPEFINKVILSMKTGMTFRSASERLLASPTELWQKWLRATLESQVFLEHPASESVMWWKNNVDELRLVHQSPHRALVRLESLRRKQRVVSEFRRKSGQATLQARIQMLVMTCLYLALLALTMNHFEISRYRRLLIASIALFSAGQFLFWRLAGKRTWKV